ncbi:peroxidase-like isoform X2 [Palaemon carinicauda]|uniref:peroxidase-like isoform X2 n=1 Tax=Palaemon carinicauda TaxID=392227 RepID=UPI0035B60A6D
MMTSLLLRWLLSTVLLLGFCNSQLRNLRPLKGILYDVSGPRNASEANETSPFFDGDPGTFRYVDDEIVNSDLFPPVVAFSPPRVGSTFGSSSPAGGGFGFGGSAGSSAGGGFSGSVGDDNVYFAALPPSVPFTDAGFPVPYLVSSIQEGVAGGSAGSSAGGGFGGSVGGDNVYFTTLLHSLPFTDAGFPMPSVEDSIQEGVAASMQQQQQQSDRPASKELDLSSKFLSAFRRAEKESEEASCVGRAMIETTKQHAMRSNIPLSDAVRLLSDLEINPEMCEKILKKSHCEDFKKPARCSEKEPYRRIDGSCNNIEHPTWGKAMSPFVRFHYPAYENGIDTMRGEGRTGVRRLPSPRTVSYNLQSIRENPPHSAVTLMVMQWGQFLDHDITFTAETQIKKLKRRSDLRGSSLTRLLVDPDQDELSCPSHSEGEDLDTVPLECCPNGNPVDDLELTDCRPIDVSADPIFSSENRTCMRFVRSLIASKGCQLGPREQLNQITGYIDGSAVYGSSDKVAQVLRKKEGGKLHKTEKGNLLPRNCCEDRSFHCFKAGDTRVNEQPGLTTMHTLWLRVHDQIATDFASVNPHWDDETLYQETRRVVIALIQQTSYREWLPMVLGPEILENEDLDLLEEGPGETYDPNEDASIANVIATAAFRFGHTLVNDAFRGAGGESVPLLGNFENAKVLFQKNTRPSAILEGLATANSQAPDFYLVLTLTNKLFAQPENRIGLDLMSLNIQRGRDHGLPPYTSWRKACQLPEMFSFDDLTTVMPESVVKVFRDAYSDVHEIDLFPAALSEFPVDSGLVGPTFACLLSQQFSRLKKGDRFFFQNLMQPKPFRPDQLKSISEQTLAAIICHNSDIESLQPHVFRTVDRQQNNPRPCSSYPKLDVSLWREYQGPPTPTPSPSPSPSPSRTRTRTRTRTRNRTRTRTRTPSRNRTRTRTRTRTPSPTPTPTPTPSPTSPTTTGQKLRASPFLTLIQQWSMEIRPTLPKCNLTGYAP